MSTMASQVGGQALHATGSLVVDSLSKFFGDFQAVDDLSFHIDSGETFGLLGPNGAGKTTTISMICGLLAPDAGTVSVSGTNIRTGSIDGRHLIGYVPQELALYPDLSGIDNLRFFGRLYGLKGAAAKSRIDAVLDIVGLADRASDLVKEYSGGMQRRLNIAAGMLHEPKLLILDEPTVGIDPQSRNAILDAVAALGSEGMSVLYTTHYMEEAERLCSRVGIVDHGKLIACGTRRELIDLVDEHDQINITLDTAAAQAVTAVQHLDGVVTASESGEKSVAVMVSQASAVLPKLVDALTSAQHNVIGIDVVEPSLDSVFLHITGTALRD